MLSILLNKQKSQYISVKNAFQSSSFQVRNFMKWKKKYRLFRIDRKSNSKRKMLCPERKE